ncbi:IS110 family transposase, partial [Kutzneria sp. NPDC051319]|uniref:IS110 family transposase n=1 Tax=Kutzneria sp. NPDC051319 TaxID=3155047 RepID=UPI003413B486
TPARKTNAPTQQITPIGNITGGVDTHRDFHVAAATDTLGHHLGTRRFPATTTGHTALLTWLTGFGPVTAVGVEGTGSYGAGLTTHLHTHGITVREVTRPNRQTRRRTGKSDPADAIAAAAATLAATATATPKPRTGPVESVRVLRTVRDQLNKARTATINTLHALTVTAPDDLRESLHGLSTTALITHCATLPAPTPPAPGLRGKAKTHAAHALATALLDSHTGLRLALTQLAQTIRVYDTRLRELDTALHAVVTTIAPRTIGLYGLGPDTTGQLLTTAGHTPDRLHSEAAFARLTGVAPRDASSGNHDHQRLSRAGDRQANAALYRVVLTRLAGHEATRAYLAKRLSPNSGNKKHLIRCLKRYAAREIYPRLMADLAALPTLQTA